MITVTLYLGVEEKLFNAVYFLEKLEWQNNVLVKFLL